MDECSSIKHNFNKTPNMYPNLNAIPSNELQFMLKKLMKLKIIL